MKQLTLQVDADRAEDLAWIRNELIDRKVRNVTAEHVEHYYDLAGGRELALEALLSVLDGRAHEGLRARLHAERQL